MKKQLLSFLLLWYCSFAVAQLNNVPLYNRIKPADTLEKQLHFNFYSFNYIRNYEYSNRFHDGYTLYGTQAEPKLVYYAHPNLALTAGAYLRKDFGREGIYEAKPLFNLIYKKKTLTLIFGALDGNVQHGYIEPLYNFERKITMPIEYGTQLLLDRRRIKLDAWLSWQQMIYQGEAKKEEIVGGLTLEPLLWQQGAVKLSLPVQLLAYHQGGQIDVLKQIPISTLMNSAIGFKLYSEYGANIKSIYTENYIAFYKDFSPTKTRAYQGGYGLWLNGGVNTAWGNLIASYWKGHNFISIKGMPLYESISHTLYDQGYMQANRSIFALRYTYQKALLPNLYLDIRFEPHIDFHEKAKNLQFNHSFFLTYKEEFNLLKGKKSL